MKITITVVVTFLVLGLGFVVFAWSGLYNISAQQPHWTITTNYIDMLKDHSIRRHATSLDMFRGEAFTQKWPGAGHYHETCRHCHGAPGVQRDEFAIGLYPEPPDLKSGHAVEDFKDDEIFWIVQNGIKMTGMPAFGPTHDGRELYAIVTFLEQLPKMDEMQYREATENVEHHHEAEEGHHEEGMTDQDHPEATGDHHAGGADEQDDHTQ